MSRRHWLAGAASSLALPLLPSLLPRSARAAVPSQPRRFVGWFAPNGMLADHARPPLGDLEALPAGIAPLAPVAHRATVMSGLRNLSYDDSTAVSFHTRATGNLLTDYAFDGGLQQFDAQITMDQVVANTLAGSTPYASMQLGLELTAAIGDTQNAQVYQSTLSWASPTQPLQPIIEPRIVFELLFGGTDSAASAAESAARQHLRFSVLDRVVGRTSELADRASVADRDKLDQYLTGIRDLEARLEQLETLQCDAPLPPGNNLPLPQLHEAMRQLMVIALQCDYTRILTFASGMSESSLVYGHLPMSSITSHHLKSHHGNRAETIDDLVLIQAWLVEQYTLLAQDLESIDDGAGGSLLDHTALLYMTEFSDANVHDAADLTWLLSGGDVHGWAHGQHRPQAGGAHANVFLNMFEYMGLSTATFGQHGREPIDLF